MSLAAHLDVLENRHVKLQQLLDEESNRPLPDFTVIQSLKKQKLLIKEEMERLENPAVRAQHSNDAA